MERWKRISSDKDSIEYDFEVSTLGRVRRVGSDYVLSNTRQYATSNGKPKPIHTTLWSKTSKILRNKRYVHRLVAQAFLNDQQPLTRKQFVYFKNDDDSDLRLANLSLESKRYFNSLKK